MSTINVKTKGYITLKSVVQNVKSQSGNFSQSGFNQLLQLAIRGYGELNLHLGTAYEVRRLTLSSVKTVSFPNDCTKWIAVGIPYRGKVWTFTKKNGLVEPLSEENGVPAIDSSLGENVTIGDGGYIEGYGKPGGLNKFYVKVDEENRQVILNGYSGTQILFYFKSTGISISQETIIPRIAEEALINWVHWQRLRFDPKANQYDKQDAKNIYEASCERMLEAQMPSLDDLYDGVYAGFMQTLKR